MSSFRGVCIQKHFQFVGRFGVSFIRGLIHCVLGANPCLLKIRPIDVVLLSGGTDGIDGPTDAAGGWVTPDTVARAHRIGMDPYAALEDNDAYHCLKAVDQLLITGPTHTNVMDIGIGLRAHE